MLANEDRRSISQRFFCLLITAIMLSCTLTLSTTIYAATKARLIDIRTFNRKDATRLVFDLTKTTKYKIFHLHDPRRLVIDLNSTALNSIYTIKKVKLKATPFKSVRHSNLHTKLRIVLDLKRAVTYHHFTLSGTKHYKGGMRLVLDIKPSSKIHHSSSSMGNLIAQKQAVASIKSLRSKPKRFSSPSTIIHAPQAHQGRDILVVIDPGHGGKDPGATGAAGTHEKNVVLSIAKDLQRDINHRFGFRALLTRNGDYFISLRKRLQIAHADHGDMFVAIHADAFANRYAHGASVFALSERGATSEAARWLAKKENESELGKAMQDKSNVLKSVLIDLAQTATIDHSLQIGNAIVHQLARMTKLHRYKVEQAAFVVLKSPDIPSLLVETGFLSNRIEEARLRNPRYQRRLAHALADGIIRFFQKNPPRGSYLRLNRS